MDTPGLVKVTEIVESYLNELGENTDNFMRYLQIAIEGITQLSTKNTYGVKAYFTSVSSNNIIHLPSDYITYNRIGLVRNGLIYTLTKNKDISLSDGDIAGVEVVSDENLNTLYIPSALNYAEHGAYNFATYRIDEKGRRIIFRGNLTGETIVIEYKSSGINLMGDTYVPVTMVPVAKEYLNMTITKRNKNISQAEKQASKIDFINAKNDYIKAKHTFSVDDFMDAVYSGYSQGTKR